MFDCRHLPCSPYAVRHSSIQDRRLVAAASSAGADGPASGHMGNNPAQVNQSCLARVGYALGVRG